MNVIGFDAGEKIDKYAMVQIKLTGPYKAPIETDDVKYRVMLAKIIDRLTLEENPMLHGYLDQKFGYFDFTG